jgi:hypothetical protein
MKTTLIMGLVFLVILMGTTSATVPTYFDLALIFQRGSDGISIQFSLGDDTTNNVASSGTLCIVINDSKTGEKYFDKVIDVKETDFQMGVSALGEKLGQKPVPFYATGRIVLDTPPKQYTDVDEYLTFIPPQGKNFTYHEGCFWT